MTKSNITYICCIIGIMLSFFISSTILDRLNNSLTENAKIYESIVLIKDLTKSAVDMETGARGYGLNTNSTFLEPYNTGKLSYNNTLEKLKKSEGLLASSKFTLEQADGVHSTWISRIQPVIDKRLAIENRVNQNDKAAIKSLKLLDEETAKTALERKSLMDSFRAQTDKIISEQQFRLTISSENTEKTKLYSKIILYLGPLVSGLIIFFLIKLYETTLAEKEVVDKKNKDLEKELKEEKDKNMPPPAPKKRRPKKTTPPVPPSSPAPRPRGRPRKNP